MYQYRVVSPEALELMRIIVSCVPIIIAVCIIVARRSIKNQKKEVEDIKDLRESFHRESVSTLKELESVTK